MKAVRASAAFAIAAVLNFWCSEAEAYRPFDGTDAAVVETGEIEVELGPVEYLRAGAERALLAPDLRINYGFIPRWEAALEGKLTHGLTAGIPVQAWLKARLCSKAYCARAAYKKSPGPVSQPSSAFSCRGSMINMGPEQSLMASSRSAGTGERFTSTRKLSSLASSTPITFSTASSRVRTTGPCGRSLNSFMRAMLACFEPAPPWSARSGRSRTMLRLTSGRAARASMARLPARSARA